MPKAVSLAASALTVGLMVVPVVAEAFSARNGARVNPVNAAVFEVVPSGSTPGQQIWCAASEYARRALNAGWQSEIYVARSMGQSQTTNRRSAVQFTLDPGAAGITPVDQSLSLNSFAVGDHMSVSRANSFCGAATTF